MVNFTLLVFFLKPFFVAIAFADFSAKRQTVGATPRIILIPIAHNPHPKSDAHCASSSSIDGRFLPSFAHTITP
jgi:hypothetical protein